MILALLLSAAVLLAPGGLAEAWPAAPRLTVLALAWGLVLGLPRAAPPPGPQRTAPWTWGLALALPALAAAWALDGGAALGRLAEAAALCVVLAWAGAPRSCAVARRVTCSWALLLAGPWALAQLAAWGGVDAPAMLEVLAGASPFARLAGHGEGAAAGALSGLPWLLGVHLAACGRLPRPELQTEGFA
ncbi:MAG: hypothetical protein ISQ08_11200 [Planctomycetes bacterium]|nr:hypothetical protein [Planctomycetota bacterium]